MGNAKNLKDCNGNLIVESDYNIEIKRKLEKEYKNLKLIIYKEDEVLFEFCNRVKGVMGTVKNTLIIIECPKVIMDSLRNEIEIQTLCVNIARRVRAFPGRFNSAESAGLYTAVFELGLILIRNESKVGSKESGNGLKVNNSMPINSKYKLLTTMLANKFNEEFDNLIFIPATCSIKQEYKINGEIYITASTADALEVTNKDGGRYVLYLDDSHYRKIPKVFDIRDFVEIYATICKISGKTVALYQDKIEDAIVVEPAIEI